MSTVASEAIKHVSMFELYTCKDLVAMECCLQVLVLPLVSEATEHIQTAQAIHYLNSPLRKQVAVSRPHGRLHYLSLIHI